ncbi:hypothetical protein [Spiroplasma culicicola]|uniref:Uncharacterized protein n=1 Tax=Spiroplasma culicicola AES-1 TaxID=1276246 RepID=W6AGJ2_9MOLU|nr:hypothetical protein [Spiroplasma culicicola]AHI52799.1 hypothetical protein SCULI_v1c04580 [Spiroplasma culicicola AES-1]
MKKNQNKNNTKNLLKKHNKIIKTFFKTNFLTLLSFLIDQIIFATTLVLFILNLVLKESNDIISFSVVGGSIFLLLKFTYTNWFAKNQYFKAIYIFDYNLKLENHKFKNQRCTSFTPIWFWIYIIAANFTTVVFINFELSNVLSSSPVMAAILESMLNVLLLPSFLNSFQKLAQSNQDVEANYKNLIKTQYFSNESLFEDAKFADHYLNVGFPKNNLVSKNGLFIFTNKKDLTEKEISEIKKVNEKVLDDYKKIWANYYELLEQSSMLEFSKFKSKSLFWIERIYDHIFLDFFNI